MNSQNSPREDLPAGAPAPAVQTGALLDGRYRLGDLVGRGGTAEVYRGRDELLGRDVAVKVFDVQLTDLNTVARQRSEMRALAALNNPHLIAVHDARLVESASGSGAQARSYLVMEFVDGGTLADRLHDGPMAPRDLAPIAVAVASGLDAAHAHGLVHRDIKPANVLIATSGAVKLGDFGLARMVATETPLTSGSMLAGTAAYFSPEQAAGDHVGAPTDVYALGLVLLEAVSGRREFPGAPVPSAMARLLRDPEIPDGLPAPWPTLLLRMTDRDPAARPTAADIVRILTADAPSPLAATETVATPRPVPVPVLLPGTPERPREPVTTAGPSILSAFLRPEGDAARRARRRNSLLAGAGAVLAAVLLVAVITVSGEPSPPADASPGSVRGDSSTSGSPAGSGVTSAPSSASPDRTVTPATTPAAVAVKASTPAPTVARTPSSASASAARAVAARAAASRTAASRAALARSAAARSAAERSAAARAEEARAAAAAEAARVAADRAAARAAAQRAAADRSAAATEKAAEKAADEASKAAEKQQKETGKNPPGPVASTAPPGPGDADKPGKPGKPGKKP